MTSSPEPTRNPNLDLVSATSNHGAAEAMPDSLPLMGSRGADWWTGKAPLPGVCPGLGEDGIIRSLPQPDLSRCTRRDVLAYFDNTWTLTEVLFSALQGEAAFHRPPYHGLRHPMIFYYGHPACLYVNKLRVAGLLSDPIDAYFEQVFETGVDEMRWDDMAKNTMEWPRVAEVQAYRRLVYAAVERLIQTHPDLESGDRRRLAPIDQNHPLWALFLACEHERIHLETSSVLLRELPLALLRRPPQWPPLHPSVPGESGLGLVPEGADPAPRLVEIPGGQVTLGKPADWPSFGWDNEYGREERQVPAFAASPTLASNADLWRFVVAGGYREDRFWTSAGLAWRGFRNAKWPSFWVADGPQGLHRYRLRTLFELVPMPWDWPAEVNAHEAAAYCAWRSEHDGLEPGYRLPTEAEFRRLAGAQAPGSVTEDPVMTLDGASLARLGINLNLAWSSPSPVDAAPQSPVGIHDLQGNVWDWCADDFHPLEGFAVHPVYEDFSTPCFDGEHNMLLGGSYMSTGDEASRWARFHFRPHFLQHAGFRLVRSIQGPADGEPRRMRDLRPQESGKYSQKRVLDQYLLLHYGDADQGAVPAALDQSLTRFPVRCAQLLMEFADRLGIPDRRVADLGCAVGGASFALARRFQEVIALDLSPELIAAAECLGRDGRLAYQRVDQGDIETRLEALVDPDIDRRRVRFRRADACSLPPELAGLDAVLAANLIDRLVSPRAFLSRLKGPRGLVRPGGLLMLTSPYTWSEVYTPKASWLGGYLEEGRPRRTLDGLKAELGADFALLETRDLPLMIREHERKYELVIAEASLWQRRT